MNWIQLGIDVRLDDLTKNKLPYLIFKHSTRCSISNMVLSRFERNHKDVSGDFYLLDLLNHREISNNISSHFNVGHESPQILFVKDGVCTLALSHNAINTFNYTDHL
jgi:bacillithiol system protein YtxJ